jgi:hypothetical protein
MRHRFVAVPHIIEFGDSVTCESARLAGEEEI